MAATAGLAVRVADQTARPPTRAAAPEKPPAPTGIDYLGLIQKRREQELQQRIDYRNLPGSARAARTTTNETTTRR